MFIKDFRSVFKRELVHMFTRPIYLFSTVFVMVFCSIFFLSLLKEGLPQKLPIGIIDHDESSISRRFKREIDATQAVEVVACYPTFQEARDALQRGEIYGLLDIPENMYADILANRRPHVGIYVNSAYLVAGTLSYRELMTMANLASAAVQREVLRAHGMNDNDIMGLIQPIVMDLHQISNPASNYGVYLLNILLPGILELMILMITIFSIGIELKTRTTHEWLDSAHGSMFAAISGKMTPYTILFVILGMGCNILLFKFMHYPMAGSIWWMMLGTVLFVLAVQAMGVFIIGLFPVLREATCMAALIGLLAFSLAGFTYPVEAMHPMIQGFAGLFPLRHYFLIYVQEAMLGNSIQGWWLSGLKLLIFLFLPMLIYRRLEKAMIYENFPVK